MATITIAIDPNIDAGPVELTWHGLMTAVGILVGLWLAQRRARELDLDVSPLAAGFPLGLAVGRIGDLINGEHFGPPTEVPWGVRYTHPDALVPDGVTAFHSGGLYEIVVGLAMLGVLWPLRRRLRHPGQMLAAVVVLYGLGRLVMFFWRRDSEMLALGLVTSQWISLALVAAGALGFVASRRRPAGAAAGRA